MDYQSIYNRLIERARTRVLKGYFERHHVVPKCMGGKNNKDNVVALTPEEHYVAHQLLVKINPGHFGLVLAALRMCSANRHVRRVNKEYGWLKRQRSELMTGDNHYLARDSVARENNQKYMRSENNPQRKNPRRGERHHFFGKPMPFSFSEDALEKMAASKRGQNNPFAGQWGWRHSTSQGLAKEVWLLAEDVLEIHTRNPKWGPSRVSKALQLDAPYRSAAVLQKLKEGWRPRDDIEWVTWKTQNDNS